MEARRRYAHDRLLAMGLEPALPAAGFFFWLPVPSGWDSGRALADALLAVHRVRVAPGDLFGPSGSRHVRLSFVTDDGRLEEGLNRLAQLVQGQRRRARKAA